MVLHIGDDRVVPMRDVVAIMDCESVRHNEVTRKFMETARQRGAMVHISGEEGKSFILTHNKKGDVVYSSPISSVTLLKRANNVRRMRQL